MSPRAAKFPALHACVGVRGLNIGGDASSRDTQTTATHNGEAAYKHRVMSLPFSNTRQYSVV